MPLHSYASLTHGYLAIALGAALLLKPEVVTAALDFVGALVGVAMIKLAPASTDGVLAALLLITLGIAQVHAAMSSHKAAAGVLCAESSLAGLLVLLGWLRGDSGLAVLAAVPAAFSAWGIAELAAAKAADTVTAAPMKTRAKKA